MSHYIDTSALIAAIAQEEKTARARRWLQARPPASVFISEWTHVEVSSALSLKMRTGAITLELRAEALATFARLHADSLPTLAVTSAHYEVAARFADQHELGLRAGDALHLAIAGHGGHRLVTFDARMAEAALRLGVAVEKI